MNAWIKSKGVRLTGEIGNLIYDETVEYKDDGSIADMVDGKTMIEDGLDDD